MGNIRKQKSRIIEKRGKEVKLRKNLLPAFFIILVLWGFFIFIVMFVDPFLSWTLPVFFLSLFSASFLTISILLANTRRGFLYALMIVLFFLFRYLGIGNVVSLFLLLGLFITVDFYLSRL